MELLVVIAIIGILASVVLASLNTARAKGADAAIKSSINNSRAQAELFYDTASTYTAMCADGTILNIQSAVNQAGGAFDCDVSATPGAAYRITSPLKTSTDHFCVDSTGRSATNTALAYSATATVCP